MNIKLHNNNLLFKDPPLAVNGAKLKSLLKTRTKSLKNFSLEEKSRMVIECQSSVLSIEEYCAQKGISVTVFNRWCRDLLSGQDTESVISNNEFLNKSSTEYSFKNDTDEKYLNSGFDVSANLKKPKIVESDEIHLENYFTPGKVEFIKKYLKFYDSDSQLLVNSNDQLKSNLKELVVIEKINDIRYINKFFERINSQMDFDGMFVGCFETFQARKKRMQISNIAFINNLYFFWEFITKRILPKLSFTKKFYFDFTKGNDRIISKAEGLGRLISCGFEIIDYDSTNGILNFVVRKKSLPTYDMNPSYGPVYKMNRVGKNGKMIGVYKFRTMHPYSEYLQDYITEKYGYSESGKPANDFRIPSWGKFMRRYWLDELPQLINVLKGEMNLVGVRPVSKSYFRQIPKEMQVLRISQKPGCIPPYVALNRKGNVTSVLQAEIEYLEDKLENPKTTNMKYFFKAIFNILFLNKRSA